ncbi:sugar transferase [Roseibium sp.]|uniref:sugar transferase n=1 Tax=Roseibium sp. TaxID=1936156 RepID=UPI003BAD98C1
MANKSLRSDKRASFRQSDTGSDYKIHRSHFDQDNEPLPWTPAPGSGNRKLKRTLDILGAVTGLILLMPLLLAISIAIKITSRGPVIFRQERYGLNGVVFTIFKFRTMYTHLGDGSGVEQTVCGDPRVTRVGSFLRKSNFDELPQLVNVLKGEMSLVGPRPHVPGMLAAGRDYEDFDTRYMNRHRVRPGITGLAQVNGCRGATTDPISARKRLEYDLEYQERQSLLLDLKIIAQTIAREFLHGNGY